MAEYDAIRGVAGARAAEIDAGLRTHMNKVYGTMSIGMLLTFAVAWAVGTSPALLSVFRDPATLQPNILGWIIMFAPLGMVFLFGAAINRLSAAGAQTFFYVFASLMGLSLAWIFVAFTGFSIAQVFLVTSIAFAGLSLWGYTTKRDISGWGSFLIMGVIGILVASIVNIFLGSGVMSLAISVLGVLIFAGLTAYDTQNIKNTYLAHAHAMDEEWLGKAAIMGALSLYLDFINMFMFLLQLLGNRE
ncbi:Bax inhibitor-1/YccA family protein [Cognatishimia sp. D5M38]|uniref:Bax inhibitor-1/YccA family protein n=3 Tax=Cognatishimia TaxID=2211635 RepID=A0A975ENH3_9RHOB|nr:Bax inhibitor-1/YccA family protein [Cognatishimia activa]MCH2251294.1 Bax inhibitor-1/YccA family protein [Cognatishimia sp.]QTN35264.1 Bax inhibitor-1/YccA family protein [Cognatishimia activa]